MADLMPWVKGNYVNGKFVCVGNFYLQGRPMAAEGWTGFFGGHKWVFFDSTLDIRFATKETKQYLAYIFPTMIRPGGNFNEDDTVYVDIYSVDGVRPNTLNGFGGVSGDIFDPAGAVNNMGISAYLGPIKDKITFRLAVRGDDFVGASFVVMEV